MTDLIDRIYFQELSERDPKDVCRRASCKYDNMNELYRLYVGGDEYGIFPNQLTMHIEQGIASNLCPSRLSVSGFYLAQLNLALDIRN